MDLLKQKLIEQQRVLGMSDEKFADLLGVSRALWQLTRSKNAVIGISVLKGAAKAFPGFRDEILAALAEYEPGNTVRARHAVGASA